MIRVALYILLVGAIAFGAAWLADRPGEIVLDWQGWHIETSMMVAVVAVLVIVIGLMIVWTLIRWILHGPAAMSGYLRERRQTRGYRALSRGMIAAGAGDARLARHSAKEADKLLRNEPLALLLDAQAAQLSGDRKAARSAFEAMVERSDTELLGLRGLMIEAQRAGDEEAVRLCVARAAERAPGLAWAANAMLEQQTRDGDWEAALRTVESQAEHRLIDKKAAKRARAVLMTAQALEREDQEPERALSLAQEANKLAPELVPAAVVAARLFAAKGNARQATRIIEKTWRLSPHPDLAEIYAHARPGDSARDRLKRAKALLDKMPNNEEGRIAVAVAAIEARDWAEARDALEPLTRSAPSQRICMFMADIAEGETGDAGKVREWLSRAVRAPRDPAWTADGYVSPVWAPISPITGHLDAFEWKVPVEALAAPEVEADLAAADEAPAIEAPPPMIEVHAAGTEADSGTAAPAATETETATAPADPTDDAAGSDDTDEADNAGEADSAKVIALAPAASADTASGTAAEASAASPEAAGPDTEAAVDATDEPVSGSAGAVPPEAPSDADAPEDAPSDDAPDEPAKTDVDDKQARSPEAGAAKSAAGDRSAETDEDDTPVFLNRPPDDPGPPTGDEEDEKPKRRFGLF